MSEPYLNDTPIDKAIEEIKIKYAAALKEIEQLKNLNDKPANSSGGHPPDLLTDETKKWLREFFPWATWVAMNASGEAYVYDAIPKKNKWFWFRQRSSSKLTTAHVPGLYDYAGSVGWKNSLVHLREQKGGAR